MASLVRAGFSFSKNVVFSNSVRSISVTKSLYLKEIREQKDARTVVVEGVFVPSPRSELLVRSDKIPGLPEENKNILSSHGKSTETPQCYMCALGLDVKHTDVLILSQFVRSDGCMLPKRITGLCSRQQKKIGKLVSMAQKAGLMINLTPSYCHKDPTKRNKWKAFNTYFDEKTIFMKRIPRQEDRFKR